MDSTQTRSRRRRGQRAEERSIQGDSVDPEGGAPWVRALVVGAVLAVAALASVPACTKNTYCPANYAHCEGNVGQYCLDTNAGEHSKAAYSTLECAAGTFCKVNGNTPFCSLSAASDPLCVAAGASGKDRRCDGKTIVTCTGGFPVTRAECAAACIAPIESCPSYSSPPCLSAFCAAAAQPDPRCPAKAPMFSTFCDGTTRDACLWGYVAAAPSDVDAGCAPGSVCLDFEKVTGKNCPLPSFGDGRTTCALSSPPALEPRCAGDILAFCDGDAVLVSCSCGFVTGREACAPNAKCKPFTTPIVHALCVP